LLANIGKVVTNKQIQEASGGASEWARRVRELRDELGWKILTRRDKSNLKLGQYLLAEAPPTDYPVTFKRTVSKRLRAIVIDRNGMTCQMCGLGAGEVDPETKKTVHLHVGHIVDKSLPGGSDDLSNLRTLCSRCNEGAKNLSFEKPSWAWLKGQVKRATEGDKRKIYEWLKDYYGD
jgi:hypothetical protein